MNFLNMFFSAIAMLLLISLLIIVHEFGHFLAAKKVGIRVDKFGFGLPFGPTLFSKKFGETEFLVHACLFGGYVSFPDEEEDCDLPMDSPRRYSNKPIGQRALVISMGVIFNVILAYLLVFLAGAIWQKLPESKYIISFEKFAPSAVESVKNSGIQQGDVIYSVNGYIIDFPMALNKFLEASKEFDGEVNQDIIDEKYNQIIKLNPQIKDKDIIPAGTTLKLPDYTDEEPVNLTYDNVIGLEKYKSGETPLTDSQKDLRDNINYQTEYTTTEDTNLNDIATAISDTKKPVSIVVLRDGEQVSLNIVYPGKDGKLGIAQKFTEQYMETKTLKQLVPATFKYINFQMGTMIYSFGKLFSGKIAPTDMNGIIAIAKIGTEIIAYNGLFQGLLLTAIISLNLAIINILPIPALDGGHLLFLIIEKISKKPVNKTVFVEKLNEFFFYLLLALIVLVIYNDIHAWIIGKI